MAGLIWQLKYAVRGLMFHHYTPMYWNLKDREPEAAKKILKKAIHHGRKYLETNHIGGYVQHYDRGILNALEKEAENQ